MAEEKGPGIKQGFPFFIFFCFLFNLLLLALFVGPSFALKCIDSTGEAAINNNDIPSAKTEAIARAKWTAVEQALGVEVKAQTVVQNMAFVDEAVSKQVKGFISSYKVVREENRNDTVWVKINACVEPVQAQEAASLLALNNSVAVFIPARKPRVVQESEEISRGRHWKSESYNAQTNDEYDETNILSETLIGRLADLGYTVSDIASTHSVSAQEIEKAMKSNNFLSLRSLVYKYLTNILVIGRIDYTVSTRKGQDIGYGLSMPFNNVTVRLTYRIVTRDNSGKMPILAAGTAEGKGMANSVEDATASGLKDLSEKITPIITTKLDQYIKGVTKKIKVRIDSVSDIGTNFEVKGVLQNIAWVTNVEEKGLGDFIVSYPENIVYLVNSMAQRGNFQGVNFSQNSISAIYKK